MKGLKPVLIASLFSLVPYLLLSWGFSELTDGTSETFWRAFAALLVIRLFFALIESVGAVLAWRLYGKRVMTAQALDTLRTSKFPMREYKHDEFGNYLARIATSDDTRNP